MAGTELDSPRGRRAAIVAMVLTFVLLRLAQLHSIADMLHSVELAGLGSLAMDLREGTVPEDLGLAGFVRRYQYGHFAQGTLVVQLLAAGLEQLGLLTSWTFHGICVAFGALTVGLASWLGVRAVGRPIGALAAAPLILPPGFVAGWQLMPYGNHTEFSWLGVLLALWVLAGAETWSRRRWLVVGALLLIGVLLYRQHAALLVGLLAATWVAQPGRVRWRGLVTVGVAGACGAVVIALLWRGWVRPMEDDTLFYAFLPRVAWARSTGDAGFASGWLWAHWSAPRGVLGGWPWRLGLGLVAVAGLRALRGQDTKMRALAVFAAAWGASALLFPLVFGEPHSEYLIPGFVGVTLLAVPGLASSTRAWRATAQLGLALLVLSGLVDNARLVRPAAWSTLSGYDGLTFARTLGVDALDADEVPYFADLAGRGDRWVGIATSGRPGCGQPLRHTTGALPQPGASRCPTWSRGQLAERIRRITPDERLPNPPELLSIGRGAWIVCDRDVEQVRAAVEGLPARAAEQIVRGAMAEQVQTGVGRAAREVDRVRGRSPP